MEDKRKRFAAEDLRALIAALLHYFEVAQKDAHTAAEVLIDALRRWFSCCPAVAASSSCDYAHPTVE